MWTILLTSCLILLLYTLRSSALAIRRGSSRLPSLPKPGGAYGLWFLLPRHRLLSHLASLQPSTGLRTLQLPIPLVPAVLISDPGLLRQILLTDHASFIKGSFFISRSHDLFGKGILNADGELWKAQRKAGLRQFSAAKVRAAIDDVLPPLLAHALSELVGAADDGRILDFQALMLRLTTRFMGRVMWDMDVRAEMPFSRAFDHAAEQVGRRFTNPLWQVREALFGGGLRTSLEEVKSFGRNVVVEAERMARGKEGEGEGNLIQALLRHVQDPQTVAEAAVNYMSAGRDTTAQAMAWTMHQLYSHPQVLGKLRLSLGEFDSPGKGIMRFADVVDAGYLSAVFAESLRLCPPIPLEIKESTKPLVLDDGTQLPQGAVVVWSPYAMARNPLLWGEDAADFRPERWLTADRQDRSDEPDAGRGRDREAATASAGFMPNLRTPFENPVFNAGPRSCVGKQLAEMLAAVVISSVVTRFDLEVQGDLSKVGADGLTMPIQGGLPVKVTRRET